jgi:hypothetical protein
VNERHRSSRSESGRRRGNTRARNNQRLAAVVQVEERTTLVSPGQNSIWSRRIRWHSFGGRASRLKSRRVSGRSAQADRKHEESRAVASGHESIREQGTGANAKKTKRTNRSTCRCSACATGRNSELGVQHNRSPERPTKLNK